MTRKKRRSRQKPNLEGQVTEKPRLPRGEGVASGRASELFTQPQEDVAIVPDQTSALVESYFRMPAIWVESSPEMRPDYIVPKLHHATMFERSLDCGIRVRVQRDGLFMFDFSASKIAAPVHLPGFVRPSDDPVRVPPERAAAEYEAEINSVLRTQILNVHQACLITAEAERGLTIDFGRMLDYRSTYKGVDLKETPAYEESSKMPLKISRNVLNGYYGDWRLDNNRPIIPAQVVERSFALLDECLKSAPTRNIAIIEAIYGGSVRAGEKRFGESVILTWAACEQMISILWSEMLESETRSSGESSRLTAERMKKLTSGRDYSASVRIEFLELKDKLKLELYQRLDTARKARNDWIHSLKVPSISQVYACFEGAVELFKMISGIRLRLQVGPGGGAGAWPIWEAGYYAKREGN